MRQLLLAMAMAALMGAVSDAQNADNSHGKCSVAGTVVDAISQEPVRESAVSLRTSHPGETSALATEPAITDDSGRFSFNNLPAGSYFLIVTHEGYVRHGRNSAGSRTLELFAGQHIDDVTIHLMPGGTISGHISGSGGKPVRGVALQALRRSYRLGKPQFDDVAGTETNDAGEYRLTGLSPGEYFLRAVPPGREVDLKNKSKKEIDLPTYFSGTSDQSRSTLLVVRAGGNLAGTDIELSRGRGALISGRVRDTATRVAAGGSELTLVEDGNVAPVRYSATADGSGNFLFSGIPRGSYLLGAEKPAQSEKDKPLWGQKRIRVGDADVRNVDVSVGHGVEVSGRIVVNAKADVDLTRLTGALRPEGATPLRAPIAPAVEDTAVKADGSFVFQDVPEGTYRINFFPLPAGFYLKAAHAPDVLDTNLTVMRGQPIQALDFALVSGVARIEGTILKDQQPAAGAAVVLVPDFERRSQPRYYRQAISDRQGRFALQNIIPGDYEIFAWEEIERDSFLGSDFIERFEGQGKSVSLKDGGYLNLQLDVIDAD